MSSSNHHPFNWLVYAVWLTIPKYHNTNRSKRRDGSFLITAPLYIF